MVRGALARRGEADMRSITAIDFHAHCLPGVDHGSASLAVGVAQRRLMREAGLSAVVATPHFYAHKESSIDGFLDRRAAAARDLLSEEPEGPTLYLGAEVLVYPGLSDLLGLERLCIEGTDILLLELPLGGWSRRCVDEVEEIAHRGITPIIAHIDRYSIRDLSELFDSNRLLYQINAVALRGLSRRAAYFRRMLASGAISAVGSDLHGDHPAAYRGFLSALSRTRGASLALEHSREILSVARPATL